MKNRYIIYSLFALLPLYGYSQISTEQKPYSWEQSALVAETSKIPVINMDRLDLGALEKEDTENENMGVPPRFGFSYETNLTTKNSGIWETLPNGGKLWRLAISSLDALSINLLYDKFWLPEGGKFFIYTTDKTQSLGAFTSLNNKGTDSEAMGFATGLLYDKNIILEYYEPKGVDDAIISIYNVVIGYKYIYDIVNEIIPEHDNTTYACHVDVNCSQGASWQNEKDAVAYIVLGGYICSGSLLNTTANDRRPVFLTAKHCFDVHENVNQWIFYWNYESSTCSGPIANPMNSRSTSGSSLLATNERSDFTLLRLSEDPLSNTNVSTYYLGWDHTGYSGTSGVGIHHPNGAQKKISIENHPIQNYAGSIDWGDEVISPPNTHWRVNFDVGTTEGGSSGSPFMNESHRVIGQLHGGYSGCPPVDKFYGRFDVSWAGNNSFERLRDWLDPNGTSTGRIDGSGDSECNTVTIANQTLSSAQVISGCNINISNTSVTNNAAVTFNARESIVIKPNFTVRNGATVTIKATGATKSYTVYSDPISNLESSKISPVSVEKMLSNPIPNPFTERAKIDFIITENSRNAYICIYNLQGSLVKKIDIAQKGRGSIYIDASDIKKEGMYICTLFIDNIQVGIQKILFQKK